MRQIKFEKFSYQYPDQKDYALKDISMTIDSGDFILVSGPSGSGKSTFAKAIAQLVPDFYGGRVRGKLETPELVGIVFQDPEKQMVMDNVEREIVFGLENLGLKREEMQRRLMEVVSFFNIHHLLKEKTYELSGGEQQKVAIASIVAMAPEIIVLDEPTSQLDPSASQEIFQLLRRLNESLGYTIILIEQRVDACYPLANRGLFFEKGGLLIEKDIVGFSEALSTYDMNFLPRVTQVFKGLSTIDVLPLTIKVGQGLLEGLKTDRCVWKIDEELKIVHQKIIDLKKISFNYKKEKPLIQKLDLSIGEGEFFALAGANGSGKTTVLKIIIGLLKPQVGTVNVKGHVGYLSQNPNDYCFHDTVEEELIFSLDNHNLTDHKIIGEVLQDLDLTQHRRVNPRDLSGGERQRVALASVLVTQPKILLLDEPTRGLDLNLKNKLGKLLKKLQEQNKTIVIVTHDMEFIASYAEKMALLFNGRIVSKGNVHTLLSTGLYYTTAISRLFRKQESNILTTAEALENLQGVKEKKRVFKT